MKLHLNNRKLFEAVKGSCLDMTREEKMQICLECPYMLL